MALLTAKKKISLSLFFHAYTVYIKKVCKKYMHLCLCIIKIDWYQANACMHTLAHSPIAYKCWGALCSMATNFTVMKCWKRTTAVNYLLAMNLVSNCYGALCSLQHSRFCCPHKKVRVQFLMEYLYGQYIMNIWTFLNKTWYKGASSWPWSVMRSIWKVR